MIMITAMTVRMTMTMTVMRVECFFFSRSVCLLRSTFAFNFLHYLSISANSNITVYVSSSRWNTMVATNPDQQVHILQ
jgi:hypothetical protein